MATHSAANPATVSSMVHFPLLDNFDGLPDLCKGFLWQCQIYFTNQPAAFITKSTKVHSFWRYLREKHLTEPQQSGMSICVYVPLLNISLSKSERSLSAQFGVRIFLFNYCGYCKGNQSAIDYAIKFCTLAVQSGVWRMMHPWNLCSVNDLTKDCMRN